MSYSNNIRSLVNTKLTDKGREKIALGNLVLQSWALGDSEINYVREDYNVDNNIEDKPARILKAVNQQPNLKYFITTSDDVIKQDITPNNISVRKINLVGQQEMEMLDDCAYYGIQTQPYTTGHYETIIAIPTPNDFASILIGDYVTVKTEVLGKQQTYRGRVGKKDASTNRVHLNISVPQGFNNILVRFYKNLTPNDNTKMSPTANFNWNEDITTYDLNQNNIGKTKVWDFNVLTYENLAGFVGKENTFGYDFIGLMENYLSYNDNMNTETLFEDESDNCAEDSVVGQRDTFQKLIGIIHYTNSNHANLFGDSFLIDDMNDKGVFLTPNIKSQYGELRSGDVLKNILDSDIIYYDLVASNTDEVVGKILPQYKMIVIEQTEIVAAMSFYSGRDYTLPEIKTQLVNVEDPNGLVLPDGKQMYITYNFDATQIRYGVNKTLHSLEYNVIKNKTKTDKNIQISFDPNKMTHFYKHNNDDITLGKVEGLNVIYQITNFGERPNPMAWKIHDMSADLTLSALEHIQNYNKVVSATPKIIKTNNTEDYNLISYIDKLNVRDFWNDKLYDGGIRFDYTSAVYQSLITININPNLFTKTLNPTYMDVQGVKPYIVLSEIGLYDSDNELVMIAKLTRPITFVTNSAIRIEFGLDF